MEPAANTNLHRLDFFAIENYEQKFGVFMCFVKLFLSA